MGGYLLRPCVPLNGEFYTEADKAVLEAAIGEYSAGSMELIGGEWNSFDSTVTVSEDLTLTDTHGISFSADSASPLSVRRLKLVYTGESSDIEEPSDTAVILTVSAPESAEAETEFTADIIATTAMSEAQLLNALNFALGYDTDKLELVRITVNTAIGGEAITNGAAFGWNGGANGISITAEGTVIATATFRVKADITSGDTAVITVGDNENTKLNGKLVGAAAIFVPDVKESDDITLYLESFEFYFITADEYKAITSDTKILAIEADTNDTTYSFGDYNFYWSSKYGAYVAIIGANITEENVKTLVTSEEGADTDVVAYNGDVNGSDGVTAGDAMCILYASVGLDYGE